MSKLKEEVLLFGLDSWHLAWTESYKERIGKEPSESTKQAYQQIKERIQAYTEHQELEARYIDIVIDLYDQLEQKKPVVTEEEIFKKICETPLESKGAVLKLLKQMLKEAGVNIIS